MERDAGRRVDSGGLAGMGMIYRLFHFFYRENGAVYAFFSQCQTFTLGGGIYLQAKAAV